MCENSVLVSYRIKVEIKGKLRTLQSTCFRIHTRETMLSGTKVTTQLWRSEHTDLLEESQVLRLTSVSSVQRRPALCLSTSYSKASGEMQAHLLGSTQVLGVHLVLTLLSRDRGLARP